MKNIERMFREGVDVPGMRAKGRVSLPSAETGPDEDAATVVLGAELMSASRASAPGTDAEETGGAAPGIDDVADAFDAAGAAQSALEDLADDADGIYDARLFDTGEASPPEEAPAQDEEPSGFPLTVLEPLRPDRCLLSAYEPAHPHSERMRQLRTEILLRYPAMAVSPLSIAVVGAGAAEGRSQLAAELALAFASLGRSTLLVDADMRNPRQHVLFGTELRDGFAQALQRGDATSLFPIEGFPTMSLMTAGVVSPGTIELLSDGGLEQLMGALRNQFEFIVVDTPRFADYADSQVIATVVGHVLTVHRERVTSYRAARAMLRQLKSARADVIGGVLNRF